MSVSPYPWVDALIAMASASAPANELAVQLPAPAISIAVPPPTARTAEAVDLSARAVILEGPGPAAGAASTRAGFLPDSRCLLTFIYRRLCSGFNINTSVLEVVALHLVSFSPFCVCHMHRFFILLISCL